MILNQKNSLEYAQQLDANDALNNYRSQFHIPKDKNGKEWIYLCGNSLGFNQNLLKHISIKN